MSCGAVILPKRVLATLQAQRAARLPWETGGFLLGMRRGRHIEITHATVQGPEDEATRFSFERLDRVHQDRAVAIWKEAGGTVGLVGDWHTHPFGSPIPSGTDRAAWRVLAASVGHSAVGIILAEGDPGVFLAPKGWSLSGAQPCGILEENEEEIVLARGNLRGSLSPIFGSDCHPSRLERPI